MIDQYDGQMIHIRDKWGHNFTGEANVCSSDYCFHEYGVEEVGVMLNGCLVYESDIELIELRPSLSVIRATETWQRAGAYYVRIQAMAKKHRIPLPQEFDEHDGPDTKYVVVTDDGFPIATARMYPLDEKSMMIGRVVVLPEYRRQGIGTMVVSECEAWAEELSFAKTVVESRDNKVAFYQDMGYDIRGEAVEGETFRCIRMEKEL